MGWLANAVNSIIAPKKAAAAKAATRDYKLDKQENRIEGRNYRTDARQDGRSYRVGPGGAVEIHDSWAQATSNTVPAIAGAVASGVTGGVGQIGSDLAQAWESNGLSGVLTELQGGDGAVSNETNYLPWLALAAVGGVYLYSNRKG